ncbi:MAG: AAA family ATPase [Nitrososphaera sp.]|nr:AAA family ATPase [Nitrososphaera sp.]
MSEFGKLLREYRKKCLDPERKRPLTQERLAILLERASGVGYTAAAISEWELGNSQIHKDDRRVLVGLVKVFHDCDCLLTLQEANEFLRTGNYGALNEEEQHKINSMWGAHKQEPDQSHPNANVQRISFWRRLTVLLTGLKQILGNQEEQSKLSPLQLHPATCGDKGINLAQQRLLISTAFGTYFAGLLERDHGYVAIQGQIDSPAPPGQEPLLPIERIFWALQYAKGPRLIVIAAEGGMGKSTLAAKIVRCLFTEQAIDMILGDSAKTQQVDILSGEVVDLDPGYYDAVSCYERLCSQLGLPFQNRNVDEKKVLNDIRNRLEGRRAIIILDNLETVARGDRLLNSLRAITDRDTRAIITTRNTSKLQASSAETMLIHLRPIQDFSNAKRFLVWHVRHYSDQHPGLRDLEKDLDDKGRIQQLLERTGGIPLLVQLIFSDIARFSWNYLGELPQLFGDDLLGFLYLQRWEELSHQGDAGLLAQHLLGRIANEQYRGQMISLERLISWAQERGEVSSLQEALRLLYERFLVVNHDPERGNFSVFPSLAEFLYRQRQKKG